MLFRLRVILALVFITALTASFLGVLGQSLAWVEFLPALLATNLLVVGVLIILTAILGRAYCAVLCPLGIFQDIVFWFKKKLRKKHVRFSYLKEAVGLRYGILVVLLIAWVLGFYFIPALLDPYSIYGRMVTSLLAPLWQQGFNQAATITNNHAWGLWEKYDVVFKGTLAIVVALGYFLVLTVLAWRYGRLYCQTICPVGTMLGTISRFSWLQLKINEKKCVGCGLCERHCRSACVDVKNHRIDSSRCVLCMECLSACPAKAISYGHLAKVQDTEPVMQAEQGPLLSRRTLLLTAGATIGTMIAGLSRGKNDLSALAAQQEKAIIPPGLSTKQQFLQKCTACQLCINKCPEQVLKPATTEYGMFGKGKPVLDYGHGYCNFYCNTCSSICPTGAIGSLALQAKQTIKIGVAKYDMKHCLILKEGVICGNCALHCPTGAITMEPVSELQLPSINETKCIGCGSCEYHCPAIPKAIRVQGK
jgi:ferredoxin